MSDIAARQQQKPAAATHQLPATETALEGAQEPTGGAGLYFHFLYISHINPSPADSMSPAPPACCQTLPKHNVVWNCLGVVVAGFRSVAWVRCRHCVCVGSGSFCQLATDRALFCLLVLLCCSCVLCLALCVCFVAFLFARCQPMDCVLIHFSSLLYAHCRHD